MYTCKQWTLNIDFDFLIGSDFQYDSEEISSGSGVFWIPILFLFLLEQKALTLSEIVVIFWAAFRARNSLIFGVRENLTRDSVSIVAAIIRLTGLFCFSRVGRDTASTPLLPVIRDGQRFF